MVSLDASGSGRVAGLIPTAWYPNSVSVSADGKTLYVVNGKSMPGPNPGNCRGDVKAPKIADCVKVANHYVFSLEKGSLWSAPVPLASELEALTKRVAENNRFETERRVSRGRAARARSLRPSCGPRESRRRLAEGRYGRSVLAKVVG